MPPIIRIQHIAAAGLAVADPPRIDFGNVGDDIGLPSGDPVTIVINIIRWLLSLLGLLAVIMVILGGFMWLTSMGNEDRLAVAKRTISGAIIGIILILLSFAIISFIINGINTSTG